MYNYDKLPPHMKEGARAYVEDHILPGGFLQMVLENNFVGAFGKADSINLEYMQNYAAWLYWDIPSPCWGSKEKVAAWLAEIVHQPKRKGRRG
jgi:hypothetical protein